MPEIDGHVWNITVQNTESGRSANKKGYIRREVDRQTFNTFYHPLLIWFPKLNKPTFNSIFFSFKILIAENNEILKNEIFDSEFRVIIVSALKWQKYSNIKFYFDAWGLIRTLLSLKISQVENFGYKEFRIFEPSIALW